MQLTVQQLATLRTWLDANADGVQDEEAAALLNVAATPAYRVWRTSMEKSELDALIDKSVFTPSDSIPVGPSTDLTYSNRAFLAQLKQSNAQWLTSGQGTLNASINSLRKNFQDCLRQIPTGNSGANQDAGWGAPANPGVVRLAMMRLATVGEKLYAVAATGVGNDGGARGTTTNPDNLGPEGNVTAANVSEARNL